MKAFVNILLIFLLIELQTEVFGFNALVRTDYRIGNSIQGESRIKTGTIRVKPANSIAGIFSRTTEGEFSTDLKKKLKKGITQIKFIEQREKKFEAGGITEVEIIKGGIGKKYVSLKIISEKGLGLNYRVEIYGK